MGAEQIICTNAIVARRVGLLHNLKRALLLEESTIVKKIRRFEDFSPPPWRSHASHGRPSGKVGSGRCTDYGEYRKATREIRHEALHKTQKE